MKSNRTSIEFAEAQHRQLIVGRVDSEKRRALIADCINAGYSVDDAERVADRISATMPGLANSPSSRRDSTAADRSDVAA